MKDIYEALARLHFVSGKCWNILFHIISLSDCGKKSISISVLSVSKFSGVDMRRTYRCLHEISDRNIISRGVDGYILFNPNFETWRLSVDSPSLFPEVAEGQNVVVRKQTKGFDKAKVPDVFWLFWNKYPTVRRYNIEATLKAWMEINPDGSLTDKILYALETLKESEQWKRDKGKWIPAAVNFISQRRFEALPEPEDDWR